MITYCGSISSFVTGSHIKRSLMRVHYTPINTHRRAFHAGPNIIGGDRAKAGATTQKSKNIPPLAFVFHHKRLWVGDTKERHSIYNARSLWVKEGALEDPRWSWNYIRISNISVPSEAAADKASPGNADNGLGLGRIQGVVHCACREFKCATFYPIFVT